MTSSTCSRILKRVFSDPKWGSFPFLSWSFIWSSSLGTATALQLALGKSSGWLLSSLQLPIEMLFYKAYRWCWWVLCCVMMSMSVAHVLWDCPAYNICNKKEFYGRTFAITRIYKFIFRCVEKTRQSCISTYLHNLLPSRSYFTVFCPCCKSRSALTRFPHKLPVRAVILKFLNVLRVTDKYTENCLVRRKIAVLS